MRIVLCTMGPCIYYVSKFSGFLDPKWEFMRILLSNLLNKQFNSPSSIPSTGYFLIVFSLSIDNWVPHSEMLLYLHLRDSKIFFILQSLTNSKMIKFQTLELSQFHKAKTCWTEIWWSSGIMSNFWGEFFYVLGGKKKFKNILKNILATALKSYIKWLLYFVFYFVLKK